MNKLKELAAITALNHMMKGGHFSICTVDSVAEMLGVNCRGMEAYAILRTVHCIDFGKMPPELREAVPQLIRQCLNRGPEFQFASLQKEVITANSGWIQRLIGN